MKTHLTKTDTETRIVFELEQNGLSESELRAAVEEFATVLSIERNAVRKGQTGLDILDGYRIVCVTTADDERIQEGINQVTRLSRD